MSASREKVRPRQAVEGGKEKAGWVDLRRRWQVAVADLASALCHHSWRLTLHTAPPQSCSPTQHMALWFLLGYTMLVAAYEVTCVPVLQPTHL